MAAGRLSRIMVLNLFKKKPSEPNKDKDSRYLQLTIREVVRETEDAISIVFEQPEKGITYTSGQFLTLIAEINGKKVRRAYSLCTSPFTDKYPAVTVKRVENGLMSNYLNDTLKAGDPLEVMEPMGVFTTEYSPSNRRHVVLLAGGSGITPLMSLAKSLLYREPETNVSLIYANRNEQSIIFKEGLEKLEQEHKERFQVIHCLDNAPLNWTGPTGLLKPELLKQLLAKLPDLGTAYTEYFMCGPEGMMANVETTLQELQIPAEKVHKESFVAGKTDKVEEEQPATATPADGTANETYEVKVILDGEEHVFSVAPGKTILETALELDIDLPYSCQSGLCTACRGKCLSGKVKLDEDEGLSESELEEGYVLTCVGHPVTPDVVIEIG